MRDPLPPIWYGRVPPGFWQQSKNRRACMEWLEAKLGIREPEDWYDLTAKTVDYFGLRGLLAYYNESIITMVQDYLPWYDWKEWLFPRAPCNFWDDAQNRLRYLKWLGNRLGFETWENWYRIRISDFYENRGSSLITRTKDGIASLIMSHFPEHEWQEWRFNHTPPGFWDKQANRRRYLEWVGNQLGYEKPDDWYGLQVKHLRNHYGNGLLMRYKNSPARLLMATFPEHAWLWWRFLATPKGFWDATGNRRQYLEWLGEQLGFKTPEDWYRLTYDDLTENYGRGLLFRHFSNPCLIVKENFPEHEWLEWRFPKVPTGFWADSHNQQRYVAWLGERLGLKKTED